MFRYSIGANQTVINSVYPKLVPLINQVLRDLFGKIKKGVVIAVVLSVLLLVLFTFFAFY